MGVTGPAGSLQGIIAANIKVLRKRAGMSQEALGEACGYHRTYVGIIERGEANMTIAALEAVAGALGVDPRQSC
jgi:transcriptional regulator with XRE-family HTH domain